MGIQKNFVFEIQYTRVADKFFKEHETVREAYENAIKELLIGDHPDQIDVKRIKGKKSHYYRIRLGGWRVIYTVINEKIVVVRTILAESRGDVYKKMDGIK